MTVKVSEKLQIKTITGEIREAWERTQPDALALGQPHLSESTLDVNLNKEPETRQAESQDKLELEVRSDVRRCLPSVTQRRITICTISRLEGRPFRVKAVGLCFENTDSINHVTRIDTSRQDVMLFAIYSKLVDFCGHSDDMLRESGFRQLASNSPSVLCPICTIEFSRGRATLGRRTQDVLNVTRRDRRSASVSQKASSNSGRRARALRERVQNILSDDIFNSAQGRGEVKTTQSARREIHRIHGGVRSRRYGLLSEQRLKSLISHVFGIVILILHTKNNALGGRRILAHVDDAACKSAKGAGVLVMKNLGNASANE